MMNEWDLQDVLTKQWAECGLHIDGQRHLLVAWEVMLPSWLINDAKKHWTEPSLDFLVADEQMRLTVIELKTRVPGIKPAWQALCQVTHRAVQLSKTFSVANLNRAFSACWSGSHGRLPSCGIYHSFAQYHRRFFGVSGHFRDGPPTVGRCVAATEFGESWADVLKEFNQLPGDRLEARACEELSSKQAHRELERFRGIYMDDFSRLTSPVITLHIA
ncbi:MAG: hypothetical protein K9N10_02890 [Deltaproteobacteria bacterium]|nr:hypothetical protein [Deltaproteobacteria bacterium]